MIDYEIIFDQQKNEWLKANRGVCFDDVAPFLVEQQWLDILPHPRPEKYPGQRIFVVAVNDECYAVPFLMDEERRTLFLKTLFVSRKLRKRYLKKGTEHE